jgi:hypothetical protein
VVIQLYSLRTSEGSSYHHMSVMELGHLLTRSGLTYLEVPSEVCQDSFCQLGNSVSLFWVVCHEAFCVHVVSSSSCIPLVFRAVSRLYMPICISQAQEPPPVLFGETGVEFSATQCPVAEKSSSHPHTLFLRIQCDIIIPSNQLPFRLSNWSFVFICPCVLRFPPISLIVSRPLVNTVCSSWSWDSDMEHLDVDIFNTESRGQSGAWNR